MRSVTEMPYKIDEELCLACGCCAESCPAGAIDLSENGTYYVIDRDVCLSCGTCAEGCPNDAISQEEEKYDDDSESDGSDNE